MKKIITMLLVMITTLSIAQVKTKKKDNAKVAQPVEAVNTYTSDKPAYVIYNNKGEMVSYSQMVEDMADADVCLFGEQHNDPISHWMELNLLKAFHSIKKDKLVVGAEMWESDNQIIMDEMMVGKFIDGTAYAQSSVLWSNFTTDYKPFLLYAKSSSIPFICTNIPRRYARLVYKKGIEYLDSLSDQAKSYLPPLPIHFDLDQPVYAKLASVFPSDEDSDSLQNASNKKASPMSGSKPSNLLKAQAIKDATMAYYIIKNWSPEKYFFHLNGEFHSANYTSIMYYLNYYNPDIKVKTISVIKQNDVMTLAKENNRANYMIIVPEDMNVSYILKPFGK